jgi:hypothetical protein
MERYACGDPAIEKTPHLFRVAGREVEGTTRKV